MDGLEVAGIEIEPEQVGYSCYLCSDDNHPSEPTTV